MSDFKITLDSESGQYDIAIDDNTVVKDEGLETAVLSCIALNTGSAREEQNRWWANQVLPTPIGGEIYEFLSVGKFYEGILADVHNATVRSLQSLITNKVASSVQVEVLREYATNNIIINVDVYRGSIPTEFRYVFNWNNQLLQENI